MPPAQKSQAPGDLGRKKGVDTRSTAARGTAGAGNSSKTASTNTKGGNTGVKSIFSMVKPNEPVRSSYDNAKDYGHALAEWFNHKDRVINTKNISNTAEAWKKVSAITRRLNKMVDCTQEKVKTSASGYYRYQGICTAMDKHIRWLKDVVAKVEQGGMQVDDINITIPNPIPTATSTPFAGCSGVNMDGDKDGDKDGDTVLDDDDEDKQEEEDPTQANEAEVANVGDERKDPIEDETHYDDAESTISETQEEEILKLLKDNNERLKRVEKMMVNERKGSRGRWPPLTGDRGMEREAKLTYAAVLELPPGMDADQVEEKLIEEKVYAKSQTAPTRRLIKTSTMVKAQFESKTQQEKFIQEANKQFDNKFKEEEERWLTIEFKDVAGKETKETFVELLKQQNDGFTHLNEQNVKVLFFRRPYMPKFEDEEKQKRAMKFKKGRYNVILAVSPNLYSELKGKGRMLNVSDARMPFYIFSRVKQCFRCCKLHHGMKRCTLKEDETVCPHCSGNHPLKECTKLREKPKCVNCSAVPGGLKGDQAAHRANSKTCPLIQAAQQRLKNGSRY